jgi:hypothetical protein
MRPPRAAGEAAVAAVAEAVPGIPVDGQVVDGFPALILMAEAESAQLAVVGSRGLGGFPGLRVGSVALALVAHAACPVVVIRDSPDGDGPIAVGVGGSPTSEAAVAFALKLPDVDVWRLVVRGPAAAALGGARSPSSARSTLRRACASSGPD